MEVFNNTKPKDYIKVHPSMQKKVTSLLESKAAENKKSIMNVFGKNYESKIYHSTLIF